MVLGREPDNMRNGPGRLRRYDLFAEVGLPAALGNVGKTRGCPEGRHAKLCPLSGRHDPVRKLLGPSGGDRLSGCLFRESESAMYQVPPVGTSLQSRKVSDPPPHPAQAVPVPEISDAPDRPYKVADLPDK